MFKQTLVTIIGILLGIMPIQLSASTKPNIVFVFADDMGYGDCKIYNSSSKIPTPNIDKLASEGILFTDAHCAGALCAPSRFGLMTGRDPVAWKNHVKIDSDAWDCMALPEMMRKSGYYTACIGKWHFGVMFKGKDGRWGSPNPLVKRFPAPVDNWDLKAPTKLGPTDRGFDYFFGTPLQPGGGWYCNMEGNQLLGNPVLKSKGKGALPWVEDFDIQKWMKLITAKSVDKIEELSKRDQPFFLYFPLNSPHKPIVPDTDFVAKTEAGAYGDYCHQVDWGVGQIMQAINDAGIRDNTILIFSSDNGSYNYMESRNNSQADNDELKRTGHRANGIFRAGKGQPYEGGHRVPYIVRWPSHIKAGSRCDVPVSLVDSYATFAAITGYKLSPKDALDSWNILPLWEGKAESQDYAHRALFHFNNNPAVDAVRFGKWKYIPECDYKVKKKREKKRKGKKDSPEYVRIPAQLYDLSKDLGEKNNIYSQYPEVVKKLDKKLQNYLQVKHSAPHVISNNYSSFGDK